MAYIYEHIDFLFINLILLLLQFLEICCELRLELLFLFLDLIKICLNARLIAVDLIKQGIALVAAAAAKFAVPYLLVVQVICGVASGALLGKKLGDIVVLAPPMLQKLPAMFTWPQLFTALIGGGVALVIVPTLRKALHR